MILASILRAFQSEMHKSNKTFIPWLILAAPIVYSLLIYIALYNGGDKLVKPGTDAWQIIISQSFQGLYILFLPLAISILVAMIYQTDHQANMWKHLYALPLPRWNIFLAKSLFGFLLIGICLIIFATLMVLSSCLLSFKYHWGLTDFPEILLYKFLPIALKGWMACMSIWSIQNWISYRFRNFAIPLSIGLAGTVVGAIAMQGWKNIFYFPYSFPALSLSESMNSTNHHTILKSIVIGMGFFILSIIDAQRFYKTKAE